MEQTAEPGLPTVLQIINSVNTNILTMQSLFKKLFPILALIWETTDTCSIQTNEQCQSQEWRKLARVIPEADEKKWLVLNHFLDIEAVPYMVKTIAKIII